MQQRVFLAEEKARSISQTSEERLVVPSVVITITGIQCEGGTTVTAGTRRSS